MKVKDIKKILNEYNDDAEVIIVDWTNGNIFIPTVGSDDIDEGDVYCRIGID